LKISTGILIFSTQFYHIINEIHLKINTKRILKQAKEDIESKNDFKVEGVSSGAIRSSYQKKRVENICDRLEMTSLAYLWERDQKELLSNMIDSGLSAILIKVACIGLEPNKHLGKSLSEMKDHLITLEEKYGANVCGEGGEFESLTLDCPLFKKKRIVIDEHEMIIHSDDAFAKVAYLVLKKFHLEDKN
jgi:diphthine-ammonia ligase